MMIKVFSKIPLLRSLVKLRLKQIDIVDSVKQCEQIAVNLEKLVTEFPTNLIIYLNNVCLRTTTCLPILGLDCEWVTQNGIRQPVALLQIADSNGMCSLIRLSKFKTIPSSLSVSICGLIKLSFLLYPIKIIFFTILENFE